MALQKLSKPLLCTWKAFPYLSFDPSTHSASAYRVRNVYTAYELGGQSQAGFEDQASIPSWVGFVPKDIRV